MDILWRVLHILMEPVPYTFVSLNQPNNEDRAHILVLLKYGKLITEYPWIYGYFLQCTVEIYHMAYHRHVLTLK